MTNNTRTQPRAYLLAEVDIVAIGGRNYVTHSGLLKIAKRNKCAGITVRPDLRLSQPASNKWVFRATVFPTGISRGFVGYGDADPSNVAPEFHGCELRIAETRAVNRALRKAYGIGLCSVEELSSPPPTPSNGAAQKPRKSTPTLEVVAAIPLRDQLRQLIRQHKLDPALVKQYALKQCAVESLRQATRQQVAGFFQLLNERVTTDREALVAELQRFAANDVRPSKEAA